MAAIALLAASALPAHAEDPLRAALMKASQGGHYAQPTSDAWRAAREMYGVLLAAPHKPLQDAVLQRLGLHMDVVRGQASFVVLQEKAENRRGRGFVALRQQAGSALMLQMPHSFKDELTRDIGLQLFTEGRAAAAVWNTVPRRYVRGGAEVNADMAHLQNTDFLALSEAWSASRPDSVILQLHGFSQDKRRSRAAAKADAILSSGGEPTPELMRMARCLRRSLVPTLRVYPSEVDELGGTTNTIGQALRARGYRGFIHLELSRPLREQLFADVSARRALLECLPG